MRRLGPVLLAAMLCGCAAPWPDMVDLPGQGLAMARTETTVAQWLACVEDRACPAKPALRWPEPDMPMTGVTFAEAQGFADWLSARTGRRYRLPGLAEWERAARAGTATAYPWGDAMEPDRAVCHLCDPRFSHRPAPAGALPANPWGLAGMHGNVWEWTADCVSGDCRRRWVAGGSWYFVAGQARSDSRAAQDSQSWSYDIGFRLVRD
jgi:formylglycine-generating enzyme required for sulfatase activity